MVANGTAGRVEAAVRAVLPNTVELLATPSEGGVVELRANGLRFRACWAGEGWLGQVRPILQDHTALVDVVVARRMSPGAREALGQAKVGWVDESGGAEIGLGTLIVSRTGRQDDRTERPARWTPAVLAVAEALLCGTRATVSAVETVTGLSTGSCTTALRLLTDLGLLVADAPRGKHAARRLADADRLLDVYASSAAALAGRESLQVGVTWRDAIEGVADVGRRLDRAGVDWAASGAAASMVIAPFLTNVSSAELYVDADTIADLEAVASSTELRPIEGGRLTLRPFPTVSTRRLARKVDGIRVAPWPRVYADLRTSGVRGEEAAEHLREVARDR